MVIAAILPVARHFGRIEMRPKRMLSGVNYKDIAKSGDLERRGESAG